MKPQKIPGLLIVAAACTTPNPDYRPKGGPCERHSQCESHVCLLDGMCSDGVGVAYVNPEGGGSACSLSEPCSAVEAALATQRPYLKMTGSTLVTSRVTIADTTLTVLADSNAELTRDTPGPVVVVDNSAHVAIFDLKITGASGAAIWMPTDNHATVSLERVTIENNTAGVFVQRTGSLSVLESKITGNSSNGVVAEGSSVSIKRSTISSNGNNGVDADGCSVNIDQSIIGHNARGGLLIRRSTAFTIANNFIVQNGRETMSYGGLSIQSESASSTNKLEFNTIVDNRSSSNETAGAWCFGGAQASNNLIFRNTRTGASNPQTFGDCAFGNSLLGASDPGFRSATDYHLTATAPGGTIRDAVDCSGVDFDGDVRPQGGKCDLGADEYKATASP